MHASFSLSMSGSTAELGPTSPLGRTHRADVRIVWLLPTFTGVASLEQVPGGRRAAQPSGRRAVGRYWVGYHRAVDSKCGVGLEGDWGRGSIGAMLLDRWALEDIEQRLFLLSFDPTAMDGISAVPLPLTTRKT